MVGIARFVSVVTLVGCFLSLIAGIGVIVIAHGQVQTTVMFVATFVSVAMLSGVSTIVWNVASIVERSMKPAESRIAESIISTRLPTRAGQDAEKACIVFRPHKTRTTAH